MKKIFHVGVLSLGLMLSNAAMAETDKYAHLRNSADEMSVEEAEQVEAGSIKHIYQGGVWVGTQVYKGGRWVWQQGKRAYEAYNKSKYVKPAAEIYGAGSAGYDAGQFVHGQVHGGN